MKSTHIKDIKININNTNRVNSNFVKIEQIIKNKRGISEADLFAMYSLAVSGTSAKNYMAENCDVSVFSDGTIECPIEFYTWPSSLSLEYTVTASLGSIVGSSILVELEREFDLIVPFTDFVELPYYCKNSVIVDKTNFYNKFGEQLKEPEIEFTNNYIKLSDKCFCVLRISCIAVGFLHTDLITFDDTFDFETNSKNKITNVKESVIVQYIENEKQVEIVESLEIPDCLKYILNACDPNESNSLLSGGAVHNDYRTVIYYSTCTGLPIDIRYEKI